MKKEHLITGGQGFIGSKIVRLTDGESYDLKSGQNTLDKGLLSIHAKDKKGIFHCAAYISVPESVVKAEEYFRNNVLGTKTVSEVAKKEKAKVVFSSSAAIYGEINSIAKEDSDLDPKSPYAMNKLDGEQILYSSGQNHVALRYFNVYGPGQSSEYAGVITNFIKKALKGEDIIINGDGRQIRDFIYVDDVVDANLKAMELDNDKFAIFNIGSGVETSINELAKMIIDLSKSSSKIKYAEKRLGDIIYSRANIDRAKKILKWEPKMKLEEGIKITIEHIRKHLN